MKTREYLLMALVGKAAKVQQSVIKALKFGVDNFHPGTKETNLAELVEALNGFLGAMELLSLGKVDLPGLADPSEVLHQKIKITTWLGQSAKLGIVDDLPKHLRGENQEKGGHPVDATEPSRSTLNQERECDRCKSYRAADWYDEKDYWN